MLASGAGEVVAFVEGRVGGRPGGVVGNTEGAGLAEGSVAMASWRLRRSARTAASQEDGNAVVRVWFKEVGRLRVVTYRTWRRPVRAWVKRAKGASAAGAAVDLRGGPPKLAMGMRGMETMSARMAKVRVPTMLCSAPVSRGNGWRGTPLGWGWRRGPRRWGRVGPWQG